MEPQIRYVTTPDGVRIAYSTRGEGIPYVYVPGWISNIEIDAQMFQGVERNSDTWDGIMRVSLDKRGTGLSQRNLDDYSLDARIMDIESVVNDIGLDTFALGGISEGGPISIAFAARFPERVTRLVVLESFANGAGLFGSKDLQEAVFAILKAEWGLASKLLSELFISDADSIITPEAFAAYQRSSANAEDGYDILRAAAEIDVRPLLPTIQCPTLVTGNRDDKVCPIELAQEVAAGIKGARFVAFPGGHIPTAEVISASGKVIAEFLREGSTAPRPVAPADGGFRAILFTDLVGHTEMMHRLGDDKGRAVLRQHEQITRDVLKAHNGSEVKTMGDGFMASFTSVVKAVECGIALQRAFADHNLGVGAQQLPNVPSKPDDVSRVAAPLRVRVGINAGEPIQEEGDLFGETVILAARIAAKADAGEILVADTVRGLCSGKGFLFSDRGEFVAKGFEDPVRIFEVRWSATDA